MADDITNINEKPVVHIPDDQPQSSFPQEKRIEEIFGVLIRVTTTPTWTPRSFYEGFAVDTTNSRFYWYDFTNNAWKYTEQLPSQTGNGGKFLKTDGSTLSWGSAGKFGGDGSDGALSISSGTTNIDLGAARVVVKNYTSISITGTAKITTSNPHSTGTLLILKSQGNVTITSDADPAIDVSGMGAAAETTAWAVLDDSSHHGVAITGGAQYTNRNFYTAYEYFRYRKAIFITPGNGGGNGSGGSSGGGAGSLYAVGGAGRNTSGVGSNAGGSSAGGGGGNDGGSIDGATGGRGGGALLIECGGALNIAPGVGGNSIYAKGLVGGTGGDNGGGGGSGGMIVILYNTLTADSGTYSNAGGAGGPGGAQAGGTAGASTGALVIKNTELA